MSTVLGAVRGRFVSMGVASVLAVSGAVGVSVAAPAPAQALDSLTALCAGLPHSKGHVSQAYKDCIVRKAHALTPSAAELRCYKGAGVQIGALYVDHKISKGNAKTLALRLAAAGAFGCISGLIG